MENFNFLLIIIGSLCLTLILISIRYTRNKKVNFGFNIAQSVILAAFSYIFLVKYAKGQQMNMFVSIFICLFGVGYSLILFFSKEKARKADKNTDPFVLSSGNQKILFYDPCDNFLVYAGANGGKTKSLGKPLLKEYIEKRYRGQRWAGFIYDLKEFDYTKTAYNLLKNTDNPCKFFYINFVDITRTYRTNPIKPSIVKDESVLSQMMEDFMGTLLKDTKESEWVVYAKGLLKGVATVMFKLYPQYCSLPHIVNFIMHASDEQMLRFVKLDKQASAYARSYIASQGSPKTMSSIMTTLTGFLGDIANNKNMCYVLSGDDFDFNLTDEPKIVAVSNNKNYKDQLSPIIALMLTLSTRQIDFSNKQPCFFFLDEATTFKIRDFEEMPSILREYLVSFVILTQSGAKLEKLYGKFDRSSIESNFGNLFIGKTKDNIATANYVRIFGKKEIIKETHTVGSSSHSSSESKSRSTVKEEKYEESFFTYMQAGEFVGITGNSNVKNFHLRFNQYQSKEEEENLPVVNPVLQREVDEIYNNIILDVLKL